MAEPYVRPFLFIAKAIILIFSFPGTVVPGSTPMSLIGAFARFVTWQTCKVLKTL